jgi:hypothetical protein
MATNEFIHYYDDSGELIKSVFLPEQTSHIDRCDLAKDNGIENWDYYEVRDSGDGMRNEGANNKTTKQWYKIKNGKIVSKY